LRAEPAGDFDYESSAATYALRRRADPRIAAFVHGALGDARTVLNVGAGAGSYEPTDRYVAAVEPSATMRARRPRDLCPAIDAVAERLPFDDRSFDAVMATTTVHQWRDPAVGLAEMRRVSRDAVVVLTFDRDTFGAPWLAEYAPEFVATSRRRILPVDEIGGALGGNAMVTVVPTPRDCVDGFVEAYYGRPEGLLSADVRASQSGWGLVGGDVEQRLVRELRADLESGAWDRQYGHLRALPALQGSLRLVVARGHPR
jgi:hypothetical protein